MNGKWILRLGLALGLAAPADAANGVETLASNLLAQAGITAGIVSLPRCTDPALALTLARDGHLLVHAIAPAPQTASELVRRADAEGFLAHTLYAEQGTMTALPYAENLVDLLLIPDLADADLAGLSLPEITRVLSPGRGAAILGRPKGPEGALTEGALRQWVGQGGAGQVRNDASGLWVVIRKPFAPGADAWTHRYHGPDNNPVSSDATLKPPLVTQWLALPMHEGWWGTAVVSAGGRMFTAWAARSAGEVDQLSLTARSLFNGTVLWQRVFHAEKRKVSYNPARCGMIATADCLYLADGDGVLVLNGETGREQGRLNGPQPGGQIKWMAMEDGLLAMLAGEFDRMVSTNLMFYPSNPRGTVLSVCGLGDGKPLWRQETTGPVDERMIALRHGTVYAHATGAGTFALDIKTGKRLWSNSDPALLQAVDGINTNSLRMVILSQRGLTVTDNAVILGTRWNDRLVALSPETGAIIRQIPGGGGRTVASFAMDGQWWTPGGAFDLITGKPSGKVRVPTDGCGPSTAAAGVLISSFGRCVDAATGQLLAKAEVKAPCDMGTLVSDGMIITPPSVCRCNFETWGYRALTSGYELHLGTPPSNAERLVIKSKAPPTPMETTAADWPAYRAVICRAGSTPASVPAAAPAERWRWSPAKPLSFEPSAGSPSHTSLTPQSAPTPPIAAAGKAWFADAPGIVRCLDTDTGKEVWNFATAARFFASPALADGRLFAGAGDGWIYCLDATTGSELWRFRAAPRDRRVMWYGHLVSAWPVVSGVLVRNGVAYAAAGFQGVNGVHVYALDAATGQVRWENHDAGLPSAPSGGTGVRGTLTVTHGRLWLAGGGDAPACFDLSTGAMLSPTAPGPALHSRKDPMRGAEIAVWGDKFLVFGGRRLGSGYDERRSAGGGAGIVMAELNADGTLQTPEVLALPMATLPAVWDNELAFVARRGNGNLEAWSVTNLAAFVSTRIAATNGVARIEPPECGVPGQPKTIAAPMRLWNAGPNWEASASALASNAVLVAYVQSPRGSKPGLAALNRTDGGLLWSLDLPSEPIFDGLCVDRAGRVLVTLRDGSLVCYGP